MKKFMTSVLRLVLAMPVAFTMAGCGASEGQADAQTTQEDAEAALKENGKSLHGETIQVTMAEARPPRRQYITSELLLIL